uniref:30S ribosomal protein S4 n=1 Tax=Partenskyella glossopodia TaxID=552666 RepID=A0A140JZL8_9EUKA|nr:30S ribosomal protein S4 [Partenskyella glossopodia]BAU62545.1 30S ribosomal protein S4 [Partenskyella glossopodia]
MARYRGSRVKIIRRLGMLPGFTKKSVNKKFGYNSKKLSQYGFHLQEKQKLRYNYGVTEHELIKYVKKARKKSGNTGNVLLQSLEMRLDNILYKTGLISTVSCARQLISHGHVYINDKKITVPGFSCNLFQKITIKKSGLKVINKNSITNPSHLLIEENSNYITITVTNNPDIQVLDFSINVLLVLEYYSGK